MLDIFAALGLRILLTATTAPAKQIKEVAGFKTTATTAAGLTEGRATHIEFEIFERIATARATAPERTAGAKTFKPARLAIGINLAAVELPALFIVAQNLIGQGDFRKFLLRLGVARVLVGMEFFGELTECLFHLVGRSRLGHAKH